MLPALDRAAQPRHRSSISCSTKSARMRSKRRACAAARPTRSSIPTAARIFKPGALDRAVIAEARRAGRRNRRILGRDGQISFIEMLRNRMVALRDGRHAAGRPGRQCDVSRSRRRARRHTGCATETTGITEGNQVFAQMPLTPNTVGAYTQISRLLQLQCVAGCAGDHPARPGGTGGDRGRPGGALPERAPSSRPGSLGTPSVGTVTGTRLHWPACSKPRATSHPPMRSRRPAATSRRRPSATLLLARPRFAGRSATPCGKATCSTARCSA